MDAEINKQMVKVSNYVGSMPSPTELREKDRFSDGADPLLIACALAYKHTVVTLESYVAVPTFKGVKIPNVCEHFGVRCVPPHQMLKELGASFGLLSKRAIVDPEPINLSEEEDVDGLNEVDENDW